MRTSVKQAFKRAVDRKGGVEAVRSALGVSRGWIYALADDRDARLPGRKLGAAIERHLGIRRSRWDDFVPAEPDATAPNGTEAA